ncbi:MAG TPA: hypothetical protein VNO22_08020 [Planctomycetota bacterium]|jgi:hypothetical protein|nr:hypothetical protein [Planctomycetota bacterium]
MESMGFGTIGCDPGAEDVRALEVLRAERRRLADLAARYSAFGFESLARECKARLADLRHEIRRRCRELGKQAI